ncbi:MAP kinase kinase [Aureococcus anophagefferens]|nr:MAP kinase kinase [Aureococcus anophagefferens]
MPRFPAQGRARADLAIALSDSSDDEYAIESPASVASQSPTTFKTVESPPPTASLPATAKSTGRRLKQRTPRSVSFREDMRYVADHSGSGARTCARRRARPLASVPLALLDHVLRFYGSYVDDAADAVGLVLEYMDGGSLDQFAGAGARSAATTAFA